MNSRGPAVGIWAGIAASSAVVGVLCSEALLEVWRWKLFFVGLAVAGLALSLFFGWHRCLRTRGCATRSVECVHGSGS